MAAPQGGGMQIPPCAPRSGTGHGRGGLTGQWGPHRRRENMGNAMHGWDKHHATGA